MQIIEEYYTVKNNGTPVGLHGIFKTESEAREYTKKATSIYKGGITISKTTEVDITSQNDSKTIQEELKDYTDNLNKYRGGE